MSSTLCRTQVALACDTRNLKTVLAANIITLQIKLPKFRNSMYHIPGWIILHMKGFFFSHMASSQPRSVVTATQLLLEPFLGGVFQPLYDNGAPSTQLNEPWFNLYLKRHRNK